MMGVVKTFKKITRRTLATVNILVVVVLCVTAYAERVSPADHPSCEVLTLLFPIPLAVNLAFMLFWVLVRSRCIAIPIAGMLLCLPQCRAYCPINVPKKTPEGCLKVMSYNVCRFTVDDGEESQTDLFVDYIASSKVDIVCLQEYENRDRDSLRLKTLSDTYTYSDTLMATEKLAVYSRYPIIGHQRLDIGETANSCAAFFVDVDGDTLMLLNLHLESNNLSAKDKEGFNDFVNRKTHQLDEQGLSTKLTHSARLRARQAEIIDSFIEEHHDMPTILCGDFNDTPVSYAHHVLTRHLTDCHTASAQGPGFTHKRNGIYVRIDNIMCSPHIQPYGCKVDSKTEASDHYPIICSLKLRQMTKK